jgi:hypothetical protein
VFAWSSEGFITLSASTWVCYYFMICP